MAKRPLDIMFVAAGLPPEELSRAGFPPAYVRGAFAPACRSRHAGAPRLYQPAMISTYFTGEKFATGQERFAPHESIWGCVHHKRAATPPVENLSRPTAMK